MVLRAKGGSAIALLFASALLAGGGSAAKQGAAGEIKLHGAHAKVEDDDGTGLYVIGRDNLVFTKLGNARRRAFAWDPRRKRVRIAPPGRPGLWIQCVYLEGIAGQCPIRTAVAPGTTNVGIDAHPDPMTPTERVPPTKGFRLATSARPSSGRSAGDDSGTVAALPECPGDPRCP